MALFLNLLPYLLWIASLGLMLALFYGMSRRLKRLRARIGQCEVRLQSETADLVNRVASLKLRLTELEEDAPVTTTTPLATGSGLDGTIRSKVLKMDRLGQSADKIADALHLPKGEVEMLVRVHKIVMRPYENAGKK